MGTSSIMEPCCIENALPRLLKRHPLATWQSNGDILFSHIIKAVSWLAGNRLIVFLVMPVVNIEVLRVLAWYWRRGWLGGGVAILTASDQTELIKNELPAEMPCTIAAHDSVKECLLQIRGETAIVVVQGALLSQVTPGHYQYVTYAGNDMEQVDMLCASATAMLTNAVRKAEKAKARKTKKQTKQKDNEEQNQGVVAEEKAAEADTQAAAGEAETPGVAQS